MPDLDLDAIRARAEAVRDIRGRKYSAQGISAIDQDRLQRIVVGYSEDVLALLNALAEAERKVGRLTADLDARFEHSPHQTAKYYGRMRVAERERDAAQEEAAYATAAADESRARGLAAEAAIAKVVKFVSDADAADAGAMPGDGYDFLDRAWRRGLHDILWSVSLPKSEQSGPWRDRHGDLWTLGADGLLHTPETRPFPWDHVERKWGPLTPAESELTDVPKPWETSDERKQFLATIYGPEQTKEGNRTPDEFEQLDLSNRLNHMRGDR